MSDMEMCYKYTSISMPGQVLVYKCVPYLSEIHVSDKAVHLCVCTYTVSCQPWYFPCALLLIAGILWECVTMTSQTHEYHILDTHAFLGILHHSRKIKQGTTAWGICFSSLSPKLGATGLLMAFNKRKHKSPLGMLNDDVIHISWISHFQRLQPIYTHTI